MNFFKEFSSYFKADQDVVVNRRNLCDGCEFSTSAYRCTQCGCFMKIKTQLASAKCPIGKW